MNDSSIPSPLIIFDGVCGLCNRTIACLIRRDLQRQFYFTPNTSNLARRCISRSGVDFDVTKSILVFDGSEVYEKSDAIVFIAERINGPFAYLRYLKFLPKALRDLGYSLVAGVRYRVFGKVSYCELPGIMDRERVLYDTPDEHEYY